MRQPCTGPVVEPEAAYGSNATTMAVDTVIEGYRQYMRAERGCSELTVVGYAGVARRFLVRREPEQLVLDALMPKDVVEFVSAQASGLKNASIRQLLTQLRSFLGYLFATGVTDRDLCGCLPGVPAWRETSLPKAVEASVVADLLQSCDRTRPSGLRNFAILTLLVRLGLRANEVASMQLEDLDWSAGELTVRGKAQRSERLPLPGDVGDALAAYLHDGRPVSTSRVVFLRAHAPSEPMGRNAVVMVPRSASKRVGHPVIGAHRLRHTAATGMLRGGASLREIAQVLRHRSESTTAIYARVDRAGLDLVVRPWPAGPR